MTASSSHIPQPSAPADQNATCHSQPVQANRQQALYGVNSSARAYIVDVINSLPEEMVKEILLKVQQKMPGILEEDQTIEVDQEDDQATEQPKTRCRQQ